MQRLITITALAFLLAGCQTVIGHGPLALTEDAKQRIEQAMSDSSTDYIAVSPDGRTVGWSYCGDGFAAQCRGNGAVVAIRGCERSGKKCYVYAMGRKVIWDFDGPALPGSTASSASTASSGGELIEGRWKRATLVWDGGNQTDVMPLLCNRAATYAEYRLNNNGPSLKDCAGEVTRRLDAAEGTWQMYCASGEVFKGRIAFNGTDELAGTGTDKSGGTATLTLR